MLWIFHKDKKGHVMINYLIVMTVVVFMGFQIFNLIKPPLQKVDSATKSNVTNIMQSGY